MRSRAIATCALVGTLIAALPADAQTVPDARRLYLEADFEGAAAAFEEVLARPSLDVPTGSEAHRYLAVLRALLGDEEAARRHAAIAVALDPAVTAPEGAPPWVGQAMDEARSTFGGRAARLTISSEPSGDGVRLTATLSPAPDRLAETMSIRCVSGSAQDETSGPPPDVALELAPETDSVHCRASAVTPGGAPLFSAREELAIAGAGAGRGALVAGGELDDNDGGGSAWPWIGLTAGLVIAGAVVAFLLLGSSGDVAEVNAPRAEW